MKEECDHTIGHLHEWVIASEVKQVLENEAYGWNNYSKTMNSLTRGKEKLLKEDYKASDFVDRRKGYMVMFNYCPNCAEKINWQQIKKQLKGK